MTAAFNILRETFVSLGAIALAAFVLWSAVYVFQFIRALVWGGR